MKSFKLKTIDKKLELAKKKFLKDWNTPNFFTHQEMMVGPEKLFKKLKDHYLKSIKDGELYSK